MARAAQAGNSKHWFDMVPNQRHTTTGVTPNWRHNALRRKRAGELTCDDPWAVDGCWHLPLSWVVRAALTPHPVQVGGRSGSA